MKPLLILIFIMSFQIFSQNNLQTNDTILRLKKDTIGCQDPDDFRLLMYFIADNNIKDSSELVKKKKCVLLLKNYEYKIVTFVEYVYVLNFSGMDFFVFDGEWR